MNWCVLGKIHSSVANFVNSFFGVYCAGTNERAMMNVVYVRRFVEDTLIRRILLSPAAVSNDLYLTSSDMRSQEQPFDSLQDGLSILFGFQLLPSRYSSSLNNPDIPGNCTTNLITLLKLAKPLFHSLVN